MIDFDEIPCGAGQRGQSPMVSSLEGGPSHRAPPPPPGTFKQFLRKGSRREPSALHRRASSSPQPVSRSQDHKPVKSRHSWGGEDWRRGGDNRSSAATTSSCTPSAQPLKETVRSSSGRTRSDSPVGVDTGMTLASLPPRSSSTLWKGGGLGSDMESTTTTGGLGSLGMSEVSDWGILREEQRQELEEFETIERRLQDVTVSSPPPSTRRREGEVGAYGEEEEEDSFVGRSGVEEEEGGKYVEGRRDKDLFPMALRQEQEEARGGGGGRVLAHQVEEEEEFDDEHAAWASSNTGRRRTSHPPAVPSTRHRHAAQSPPPPPPPLDSPPPTSQLVSQMFGKGRKSIPSTNIGSSQLVTRCKSCEDKANGLEAAMEKKLAELEEEIAKCKEERMLTAAGAKKNKEALQQEIRAKRQEVESWAASERANMERWVTEQRQAIDKEKKSVARQHARALQMEQLQKNTLTKHERTEIEALKATIEKMKMDEETRKRKNQLETKRLQKQVREQATKIKDLEQQVCFMEQERLEVWERSEQMRSQLEKAKKALAQQQQQQKKVRPGVDENGEEQAPPPIAPPPARKQVHSSSRDEIAAVDTETSMLSLSHSSSGTKRKRGCGVEGAGGPSASSGGNPLHMTNGLGMSSADVSMTSDRFVNSTSSWEGSTSSFGNKASFHKSYPPPSSTTAASGELFLRPLPEVAPSKYDPSRYQSSSTSNRNPTKAEPLSVVDLNQPLERPPNETGGDGGVNKPGMNGGKVVRVFADGRQAMWYANGTHKEVFPDGRSVVRFSNGDVKKTNPQEGTVVYYYADARTTQTTYYKSGLEVFEFPNGQVEKHFSDGSKEILFPDSTKRVIPATSNDNSKKTREPPSSSSNRPPPTTTTTATTTAPLSARSSQ